MPTIKKENLLLKTFDTSSEKAMSCNVVQLNMKGLYSSLHLALTAYVVPMICSPLQKQPVKFAVDSYSHLKPLQLADDGDLVSIPETDILVGAECRFLLAYSYRQRNMGKQWTSSDGNEVRLCSFWTSA